MNKIEQAFKHLEDAREAFMAYLRNATPGQLNFKPDGSKWSMLEVASHILQAEEASLRYMQKKLSTPERLRPVSWMTSIRYGLLNLALRLPLKYRAPEILAEPETGLTLEQVETRWEDVRQGFRQLMASYPENVLQKEVFKHPLAGRFNMQQAFEFMATHIRHHIRQLERIRAHPDFPR